MCGFVGFNWPDKSLLENMKALIEHRGPDNHGSYLDAYVSLGHQRLSIIDLSEAGKQPMANHDETLWLVFNGEIYNYIELRRELENSGCCFRTQTDSEILLHGYQVWGERMLERLNGMFAFAIYDTRRKMIFLARDPYGIKPLHYWENGKSFIFSSEIKPILLGPDITKKENPAAIYDYLNSNCYDHTSETFFYGIKRLLPGQCLKYDLFNEHLQVQTWYQLPESSTRNHSMKIEDAAEELRFLFFESIRLRFRSDVEIGSCLSGGLDSSAIVCSLPKTNLTENLRFKTFTALFREEHLNEKPYLDSIIEKTRFDSYSTYPNSKGLASDLETLIAAQEEPFGGTSIYAQWEVMKLAHQTGMKVLLDGQGADELLAGYPVFYGYYFLERLRKGDLVSCAQEIQAFLQSKKGGRLERFLTPFFLMMPPSIQPFLRKSVYGNVLSLDFHKKFRFHHDIPRELYQPLPLNEALRARFKYSLPQLLKEEDRNSMRFSIETRLPFLDPNLVHFILSLPSSMKFQRGITKYILRYAMRGQVPNNILERRTKLGFTTPIDRWMREARFIAYFERLFADKHWRLADYIDQDKARELFRRHASGQISRGQILWKILNLEIWMKIFFDPKRPSFTFKEKKLFLLQPT